MTEHKLISANGCIVDPHGSMSLDWPKASKPSLSAEEYRQTELRSDSAEACVRLPEVVIYEHIDFGGRKDQTSLNWSFVGSFWNDRISSIVVLGGQWRFFEHINYGGNSWLLKPGQYRWVASAGIPNDIISSFRLESHC